MALPKRRHSHSRTRKRRSHDALTAPNIAGAPSCAHGRKRLLIKITAIKGNFYLALCRPLTATWFQTLNLRPLKIQTHFRRCPVGLTSFTGRFRSLTGLKICASIFSINTATPIDRSPAHYPETAQNAK